VFLIIPIAKDTYDLEGNYITTFESLTDAAKTLNLNISNLTTCCKKDKKVLEVFSGAIIMKSLQVYI